MTNTQKVRWTIALSLLGVGAMAVPRLSLLPRDVSAPAALYDKLHPARASQTVIAGDSRVMRGVSPGALLEAAGSTGEAINLGFAAVGYSSEYLDAIAAACAADCVIVLGITPLSLTPRASEANVFLANRERPEAELWLEAQVGSLLALTAPLDISDTLAAVTGKSRPVFDVRNHEDGWAETYRDPEAPGEALRLYPAQFAHNRVSPEVERRLMDRVEEWSSPSRGWKVVGFRPPTTPAMERLEAEDGGFSEESFVAEFEARGGAWITLPNRGFDTYDGSHLRGDAAREASRAIGAQIRGLLTPGAAVE